ncbi:MAG TPA: TrkA family potassium uptake protein [Acidimicrobiales bacterium]|nr:TrkA family potassium uptake protein [Acidimicrobiales bacterium]
MQVIIMGCGRSGSALASRLETEGDVVTLLDPDESAADRLPVGFKGRFIHGSGTSRTLLEDADIAHAEAFVALSPSDSANIVAARTARDHYRVPRVFSRLFDPARAPIYSELGIATVGSVQTNVNRVHHLLHHRGLEPELTFGNGETMLVRSFIPDYLGGRRVAELNVAGEIQVVEIGRAGHSSVPEGTSVLQPGDFVSFIVASGSLGRLRSFLDRTWS